MVSTEILNWAIISSSTHRSYRMAIDHTFRRDKEPRYATIGWSDRM